MKDFKGSVYGEITEKGTEKLIGLFADYFNDPNGVFYDLGSGKGDLVLNVKSSTAIGKAVGVELHPERHLIATEKLKEKNLKNVYFVNENILQTDLSKATIIYYANEGIPKAVSNELWHNIPNGCMLVCGRKVNNLVNKWKFDRTEPIEKTYTNKRGNWYIIKNDE
jgi:hypothetical protein